MPPVSAANAQSAKRESFLMVGTFNVAFGNAAGQQFGLTLPTDQDGDFWCDQIFVCGWRAGVITMIRPPPALISISDMRTALALTWPSNIPLNFLTTLLRFSDDPTFDPSVTSLPDGFRSTSTLPQPFCFTRSGGIVMTLTMLPALVAGEAITIDIGFGGWKEYENASS